jgi:hypothetical protein
MPFTKLGGGMYQGPSGRKFNLQQVKLYYAGGDHFPGQPGFKGRARFAKGGIVRSASHSKAMDCRNCLKKY